MPNLPLKSCTLCPQVLRKLLLFDDEALLLTLGQKTLTRLGYEVQVSPSPMAFRRILHMIEQRKAISG